MAGVSIEIGGRAFELAPFKLGEIRKAAPHIDRMNDLMREINETAKAARKAAEAEGKDPAEVRSEPPFAIMADLVHELCEIIAIGLSKIDPELDCAWLEDQIDLSFMFSLQEASLALLRSSGLAPQGEAQAPSPPAEGAQEASESNLAE